MLMLYVLSNTYATFLEYVLSFLNNKVDEECD